MAPITITTQDILQDGHYNRINREFQRKYIIILKFEAFTPVWTGGLNGNTRLAVLDENNSIKINIEQGPNAQTIIGVARWLLRAVGPCKEREPAGHDSCELSASYAFGRLGEASPVLVNIRTSRLQPVDKRVMQRLERVPRVRLLMLGRRRLPYSMSPIAPNHVLWVWLQPRSPADMRGWKALILATASIATSLTLIGIGKATTRGFGRYRLVSYTLPQRIPEGLTDYWKNLKELLDKVKRILDPSTKAEESARAAKDSLETLSQLALNIVGVNYNPRQVLLPRLDTPLIYYKSYSQPGINPPREDVIGKLAEIGRATLKVEWKRKGSNQHSDSDLGDQLHAPHRQTESSGHDPRRDPGPHLHTWPLGLPRGQYKNRRRKQPEVWTGYYYVIDSDEMLTICCDKFIHINSDNLRNADVNDVTEPRLKSPLIIMPLPAGILAIVPRMCDYDNDNEDQGRSVLLGLVLEDARKNRRKILIHSGKHNEDLWRRIPVKQIIEYKEIPRSCEGVMICPDPESEAERGDPGGIMSPLTSEPYTVSGSVDVKACRAWLAAVEWVQHILGLERLEQESGSG